MAKKVSFKDYQAAVIILLVVGALFLGVSGWVWWEKIHKEPSRVFWSMVDGSLTTSGVTRRVIQQQQGSVMNQVVQLSLGSPTAAHAKTTLTQTANAASSKVTTEEISTLTSDYVRYIDIQTSQKSASGAPLDFSNIRNVWGKNDIPKNQKSSATLLNETLLGVVPIANLNTGDRRALIRFIHDHKVFAPDFTNVKHQKEEGRAAYVYNLKVDPVAYVGMLQQFAKAVGLGTISGLDPAAYQGQPALVLEIAVDTTSDQLLRVSYPSSGRTEVYSGYGLRTPLSLPTKTVSIAELQNRVQSVR